MEVFDFMANMFECSGELDDCNSSMDNSHSPGFNPANGLPMINDTFDIELNMYGTDSNNDDWE